MVIKEQARTPDVLNHELVDLRLVKKRALEILPAGDPVREAIIKEPDLLPRPEGLVKLATYARVLMSKRAPR